MWQIYIDNVTGPITRLITFRLRIDVNEQCAEQKEMT